MERDDIVSRTANAGDGFPGYTRAVPEAEIFGIDAGGEEQGGVDSAGEIVVQALPVIFEMVFGKVVLRRGELVAGMRRVERVAAENVGARGTCRRVSPGKQFEGCRWSECK